MRALVDAITARNVELAMRLCTEHLEHAAASGLAALGNPLTGEPIL
jgi:DNA-binding GntR family transcriptional regulator